MPNRAGPVRTLALRARWELRTAVGRSPSLCRLLVRRSGEMPTAETEISVEGFPRSGNTFAVVAFQQAQPATVSIAHHVHLPGAVIAAAKLRKPAVVLIREPEEAVLSLVLRFPFLSLGQGLSSWIRFYEPLLGYRGDFVTGRFDRVVEDLGSVIRAVNQRFGSRFEPFQPTEANLEAVRREVERWDRGAFDAPELPVAGAWPNEGRTGLKEELRARFGREGLAEKRDRARRLYEELAGP
jgi:hypothetical protein